MRICLLALMALAVAAPCHAQNGADVTLHVEGREIVARDWVGQGQFVVHPDGSIELPDYEYSANFPRSCAIRVGDSGGHAHGVAASLDRNGCGAKGSKAFMRVWADFNTLDETSTALAYLKFSSACGKQKAEWGKGEWRNAVDGLKTAMCKVQHKDGSISLTLLAGVGHDGGNNGGEPRIYFEIELRSTAARWDADMKPFRTFVCAFDATEEEGQSTLCPGGLS